jgi:phosphatidylglycerophosphate synthase/nicotinamide mononucleotide adenylyltransferase
MWRTKPTDRFVLKWIKLHLSARVTPLLARIEWLRPAHVTIASTLLGSAAGLLLALRCGWQAGIVAAIAQILDGVDGQLARLTGRASPGGAFWDSVLDRYADGALVIGTTIYAARVPIGVPMWLVLTLGSLALIGGNLISYSSARAQTLGLELGPPTLASKGTRTTLMILAAWGTLLWRGAPLLALGIIALHANIEVLRRLGRVRAGGQADTPSATGATGAHEPGAATAPYTSRGREHGPIHTGVIHGRFQVLHNDHLRYLLAGRAACRHLVVGITNPDPTLTRPEAADPQRGEPLANPLTYFERAALVRAALAEAGVPADDYTIVPFPVNVPELYIHYVPMDATFFLTIYDDWGRAKLARFEALGLKTRVLWERPAQEKGLSGREVRRRMVAGEDWRPLVPASVARLLEAWRVPERMRAEQLRAAAAEPDGGRPRSS